MERVECTIQTTSQAIMAACSVDYTQVKQAEQMILQLEVKPNFFPILAEMSLAPNVPVNIKRMAAICLKNGVTKFWRTMSPNAIRKEDKDKIKHTILACHVEESKEVFDQLIEVVVKISRYDFPKNWPEFVPTLIESVQELID